jgi:hypothetical protein
LKEISSQVKFENKNKLSSGQQFPVTAEFNEFHAFKNIIP